MWYITIEDGPQNRLKIGVAKAPRPNVPCMPGGKSTTHEAFSPGRIHTLLQDLLSTTTTSRKSHWQDDVHPILSPRISYACSARTPTHPVAKLTYTKGPSLYCPSFSHHTFICSCSTSKPPPDEPIPSSGINGIS